MKTRVILSLAMAGVMHAQTPPKPVDQMSFKELLTAAKEDLNNITMVPTMSGNPYIVHLQDVVKADSSIGLIERGADGLIHEILHPIEYVENGLHGMSWDARHITSYRSSFILLRGLIVVVCLYLIFGSLFMAKYYDARGLDRLPHLSFWLSYPGLVTDGVFYVRDLVGLSTGGVGGAYERISSTSIKFPDASRDTFSQFEPI